MHLEPLPWPRHPAAFYAGIRHLPWPAWLDSGGAVEGDGRWHLMVAGPRRRLWSDGAGCLVQEADGRVRRLDEDPLALLRRELSGGEPPPPELPFAGGALGYLSYDFGRRLQGLSPAGSRLPELAMGLYDWAVVLDRRHRRAWLAGTKVPPGLADRLAAVADDPRPPAGPWRLGQVRPLIGRGRYARDLARIRHYLREGDCYQVNYAQPFEAAFTGDPLGLHLALREANPVPYGALLEHPFVTLLSASPELFLRVRQGRVVTRPIKGTRPRGASPEEDAMLARELAGSAKDRAENLMIVDLLRNDLGRVCVPGSIEVPELFAVHSFPTVHHLVSTVRGRLSPERDVFDLLAAAFPGGSITGAPKRRAMEIIQELEVRPREVYCGAIGWIGPEGNMETSIAIRTLQIRAGRARYWAGGGIVIDSVESEEYREVLDKAAAFLRPFPARDAG